MDVEEQVWCGRQICENCSMMLESQKHDRGGGGNFTGSSLSIVSPAAQHSLPRGLHSLPAAQLSLPRGLHSLPQGGMEESVEEGMVEDMVEDVTEHGGGQGIAEGTMIVVATSGNLGSNGPGAGHNSGTGCEELRGYMVPPSSDADGCTGRSHDRHVVQSNEHADGHYCGDHNDHDHFMDSPAGHTPPKPNGTLCTPGPATPALLHPLP